MSNQQTLASTFSLTGVGLHGGVPTTVTVKPAPPSSGRYFVRDGSTIPATLESVSATVLSTELRADRSSVRTVEHLLSALNGLGVDNACIEVDGPEIPILDGSALPWVEAIARAGIQQQAVDRPLVILGEPIAVYQGDSFVTAVPSSHLRFTYGIEFDTQAIGCQWFSWDPEREPFAAAIAPARTFTLAFQVEQLRAAGLIKGGSLDNAIVCDDRQWLNPPLRFDNEPCRHKLLDLLGDLSLLGFMPQAHIVAFKASHALHAQFALAVRDKVRLTPSPNVC